jgi:hypothetical protein
MAVLMLDEISIQVTAHHLLAFLLCQCQYLDVALASQYMPGLASA